MRRTLIALAALGLVFGLTASPAHAAGDIGACLIDEARVLADEGTPLAEMDPENTEDEELALEAFEECEVIANPILPATNELIWGSLAFLVLFVVLLKFAYPPVRKAMADRTEKIRDEVEQAERIRQEATAEESAREDELKEARKEAAAHVEAARKEADDVPFQRAGEDRRRDGHVARAGPGRRRVLQGSRRCPSCRGEVATLAIGAAEQVVGQNLDRAANERLVEDFIDRVGSGSGAG